ncbi:hypothetical protein POKO110462_22250 [Pontibacter korlensis]|uniref:STAS/SEC14 domain-containing protein n=1 Tax=Pontibacter korlensis TaxID=400092 RepID=A0A0E3UZB5_9BACT|nr:hypothetical protein [Pontibacter korlensis]AKD05171.1 hypothetical protein PKOR_21505 [Pontibacter korlensis]
MAPNIPNYLVVDVIHEENLLRTAWLRSVNSQEYREGLNVIRQLIREQHIRLWLSDSRQLAHVTFEDQRWILKEIIPLLVESSLRRVARVVNPDVFSYISFENMMSKAQESYSLEGYMEQFTSEETALGWLRMD